MTNNKLYARDDYLKKKAADSNGLNIQLTNNYAFRKTFKNTYIAKGFLMALLGLKEDEIADLKVTDPFEEGESEQEKEGILDVKIYLNNNKKINIECKIVIRMIGRNEVCFIIAGCLQMDFITDNHMEN